MRLVQHQGIDGKWNSSSLEALAFEREVSLALRNERETVTDENILHGIEDTRFESERKSSGIPYEESNADFNDSTAVSFAIVSTRSN